MSNYIYSSAENSFFPLSLKDAYENAGTWPGDGVEVSDEVFSEFINPAPAGKVRGSVKDGLPAWVDEPAPSAEELVILAEKKRQSLVDTANTYINGRQWPSKLALGRLSDSEKSLFNLWLDYLDALIAIDTSAAPDISWPEIPSN